MSLASLNALVAVVAADRGRLLDALDALRVHDRRRWLRLLADPAPLRRARCGDEVVPPCPEGTRIEAEAAEVAGDRLPRGGGARHAAQGAPAPPAASTQEIGDCVEDGAQRMAAWPPTRSFGGEMSLQALPFGVGEIARIDRTHAW